MIDDARNLRLRLRIATAARGYTKRNSVLFRKRKRVFQGVPVEPMQAGAGEISDRLSLADIVSRQKNADRTPDNAIHLLVGRRGLHGAEKPKLEETAAA